MTCIPDLLLRIAETNEFAAAVLADMIARQNGKEPTALKDLKARHEADAAAADLDPLIVRFDFDGLTSDDAMDWLDDQGLTWTVFRAGDASFGQFENEADAAIFKLRWG